MKLKKSNCDETQKCKLQGNSKSHIVMKLKYSNGEQTKNSIDDKTQIVTKPKKITL